MTEVTRVNVQFGSTIWGTAKTQNADAPRRDCSDSSFSMPEETGRGLTSCQRLQGDRPSATFSSTKELLWANENIHCPVLSQASYRSQSYPSCQRRAWIRLSGRLCPRNTRSGCSSSVWPEWRRWQTHSPGFLPAADRTGERSEDTLRSNCHSHRGERTPQ